MIGRGLESGRALEISNVKINVYFVELATNVWLRIVAICSQEICIDTTGRGMRDHVCDCTYVESDPQDRFQAWLVADHLVYACFHQSWRDLVRLPGTRFSWFSMTHMSNFIQTGVHIYRAFQPSVSLISFLCTSCPADEPRKAPSLCPPAIARASLNSQAQQSAYPPAGPANQE